MVVLVLVGLAVVALVAAVAWDVDRKGRNDG